MKKRLHLQIALVGGQPTPVYQGITHMQPDQVMLICSSSSRKTAEDIRSQLPSYSDKNIFIYEMSENDLAEMYKTADTIVDTIPKGTILSLNLTGGMKLWSIIFSNIFRRRRRSCHSFCIGQNGTLFDLKEKVTKGHVAFDMDAQFKILGHQLNDYTPLSHYTKEDFNVLDKMLKNELSAKNYIRFQKLVMLFMATNKPFIPERALKRPIIVNNGDDFIEWDNKNRNFTCRVNNITNTYSSDHAPSILLNTGWFELYTARYLSRYFSKENIRLNCVFLNTNNLPKNEIDIIINTGSKLIFVECKTQIADTTAIDKFNSAVKNYGGLGSKALFVTNGEMKSGAKEKCNDYNIQTFSFGQVPMVESINKQKELDETIKNLLNQWNIK